MFQVISSKVERCIDIAHTADRYRYDLPNITLVVEWQTRCLEVAVPKGVWVRVPSRVPNYSVTLADLARVQSLESKVQFPKALPFLQTINSGRR